MTSWAWVCVFYPFFVFHSHPYNYNILHNTRQQQQQQQQRYPRSIAKSFQLFDTIWVFFQLILVKLFIWMSSRQERHVIVEIMGSYSYISQKFLFFNWMIPNSSCQSKANSCCSYYTCNSAWRRFGRWILAGVLIFVGIILFFAIM